MIESSQAVFVVPARRNSQQEIVFGRVDLPTRTMWDDSEEDEPTPQFTNYSQVARRMMGGMGYDFARKEGLNYGKGRRTPAWPVYVPKGKPDSYYSRTRRGLGYASSSSELRYHFDEVSNGSRSNDQSSPSSAWDSDASIGDWFVSLTVNMTTSNTIEIQEDERIPLHDEAWDRHVDANGSRSNDQSSASSAWDSDASIGDWFVNLTVNLTTSNTVDIREDEQIPLHDEAWDRHVNTQWNGRFE